MSDRFDAMSRRIRIRGQEAPEPKLRGFSTPKKFRSPPDKDPVTYRCTGCGRIADCPDSDLRMLQQRGHLSCCPERNMIKHFVIPEKLREALYEWLVECASPKMGKFEAEELFRQTFKYFNPNARYFGQDDFEKNG